jgi:hypothetical protein
VGDVIRLDIPVNGSVELEPDALLAANEGKFSRVVLLGYDTEGAMAVCSTHGPLETLWMIERAKHHLLHECCPE